MSPIKLYQADAFTSNLFGGNPAAVCMLGQWLPEQMMQQIAQENNLSETAFLVKKKDHYEIRWYTPVAEVELCGHATLASAHILFSYYDTVSDRIIFRSRERGDLQVLKSGDWLTLDFPSDIPEKISAPKWLLEPFDIKPLEVYKGTTDYMMVYEFARDIEKLMPDFVLLGKTNARGVIVTAPGTETDFVSRFFAPQVGINEDPVTGSAHTTLTPYWSERLGKRRLTASQVSARRGELTCEMLDERVLISGKAVTYLVGEIML
ncbi:MAG: PhzF family phenazine biosynthesis protein [bacterium]